MRKILMSMLAGAALTGWAQQSAVCNEDGTVTFRYRNGNAKEVLVDVQFAGRNPMTRDADGIWTAHSYYAPTTTLHGKLAARP